MIKLAGEYFYGNKASDYAIENGFLDYRTLAKSFDAVLYNDFYKLADDFYCENGADYDEDTEEYEECFQYYIVDSNGAEILEDAGEIVYYSDSLDMYVWGVTHYGTSWDYVLTNIRLNCEEV